MSEELNSTEATSMQDTLNNEPQEETVVDIKSLLKAGAHYGHQTVRWNPKMIPYIYGERNNIHIINLDITLQKWLEARKFIVDKVSQGATVLFVATKQQAKDVVREAATRCDSYYINNRWLGGTLTNFATIKRSIEKMNKLKKLLADAENEATGVKLNKKEKLDISKTLDKLAMNLAGIYNMKRTPDLIFIVDVTKEDIAVKEAKNLNVPVIALVDTNCDPTDITYPIPSNDDALRTISLFCNAVADAVCEGKKNFQAKFNRTENMQ